MTDDTRHQYRGPRGRVHFPQWTKGCYYHNELTCCWLCFGRLFRGAIREGLRGKGGGE